MCWLISLALLVASLVLRNTDIMIAAGLFAIAGEINFKDFYKEDSNNEKQEEQE